MNNEFEILAQCDRLLEPMGPDQRRRVLVWLNDKYLEQAEVFLQPQTLESMFNKYRPKTQAQKALVAAIWLHEQGEEYFTARRISTLLKSLGESVGNITRALYYLEIAKPGLVLATKPRSGVKQKQSQKQYQLTTAGLAYFQGYKE